MLDETLRQCFALHAIVTVVNGRHLYQQLEHDEAREQIAFADVLLLNKTELTPADVLDSVEIKLRRLNCLARIHRTRDCDVSLARVLDVGAFDLKTVLAVEPNLLGEHEHHHDQDITCVAVRLSGGIDPIAFNRWLYALVQSKGRELLRLRGIVNLEGEQRRFVLATHDARRPARSSPGMPANSDAAKSSSSGETSTPNNCARASVLALQAIQKRRSKTPRSETHHSRSNSSTPEIQMPALIATMISLGVLATIDTYLTATILPVPVWVTFIAWASFFTCGGGRDGFLKSVASNWTGIVVGSLTLLVIHFGAQNPPRSPWVLAPLGWRLYPLCPCCRSRRPSHSALRRWSHYGGDRKVDRRNRPHAPDHYRRELAIE